MVALIGGGVDAAGRRRQAVEQAGLVLLGLEAADHPGAGVGERLVVDVDRVLGGEHQAHAEGPGLLEEREDRRLGRRRRRGRHEAHHLVEVDEGAELVGAGLAAHPGDELREHERDDELPLLVGQVGQRHDGAARLAARGESRASMSSGSPWPHAREGGRGQQAVEPQGQLRAVGRREELVELEHAELAQRRRLHLADEAGAGRGPGRWPRTAGRCWRAGCAPGSRAGRPRCPPARAARTRSPRPRRRSSRRRCPRAAAAGCRPR